MGGNESGQSEADAQERERVNSSNWHRLPFPEVIDFQEGPGILAKDFCASGVPLIRLSGLNRGADLLDGCNYLDPQTVQKRWEHFKVKEGDTLLSTSASLGRTALVDPRTAGAIPYTGIIRMRPRDSRLYGPFIQYLLQSTDFQEQVEAMGVGSVIRHFGPMHLRQMKVTIPPVSEQRAIAHILGTLDDKIELNRRMNETLEGMARAVFENLPPFRRDASANALEPNAGWSRVRLAQVTTKIGSGATPRGGSAVYLDEGIAFIRSQNVYDVCFEWDGLVRIGAEDAAQLQGVEVFADDILINITGDSILRTCIVEREVLPARVSQHVAIIRVKAPLSPRFVLLYLMRSGTKDYLLGLNAGATRKAITKGHLEGLEIPVPPTDVMESFSRQVDPLFERIHANRAESRSLAELRDTLLPKLLSGEIRIPDAEKPVSSVA